MERTPTPPTTEGTEPGTVIATDHPPRRRRRMVLPPIAVFASVSGRHF